MTRIEKRQAEWGLAITAGVTDAAGLDAAGRQDGCHEVEVSEWSNRWPNRATEPGDVSRASGVETLCVAVGWRGQQLRAIVCEAE